MLIRIICGAVLAVAFGLAQQPSDSQPKDIRDTPRGTLLGFLEASSGGDYRRAASFLNIRKDHRRSTSPEELAQELKRVLDRKLAQDLSKISSATEGDLTDGLEPNLELIGIVRQGDRNVDLLLERVRLPEVGEVWLVAASTVSLIPILHADIDTTWLESFLPHWLLHTTVFDTPLWQWLAILILTLVATAFGHVLARILIRSLNPLVRRTHSALDDRLIEALRRPLQLLFALAAFRAGLVWIAPSYLLRMYLGRLLTGIIYLSIAWVLVRLVDVITTKLVAAMSGRQKTTVASIMPLTRRTIKVFVVCIAILATISSWGYDTTALLAGLGVGGVAVALAAQKTLENLFGGLAITSDKPVLVGDFCKYGDKVGTVEDIGLRSTRIRSLDRTIVTVPNGEFSGMQIENFGKRDKMSFRPILQLRRDTAPQKLHSLLPRLRQLLLDNPHIERTPRVRLLAIGSQSLDIEIFSYVLTPDYDEFLLRQEEILLRLLDVFAAERVELAMPMQLNFDGRQREIPRPSPQQPEPSQEK